MNVSHKRTITVYLCDADKGCIAAVKSARVIFSIAGGTLNGSIYCFEAPLPIATNCLAEFTESGEVGPDVPAKVIKVAVGVAKSGEVPGVECKCMYNRKAATQHMTTPAARITSSIAVYIVILC